MALLEAAVERGHEVTMSAPRYQQSAASHRFTLTEPCLLYTSFDPSREDGKSIPDEQQARAIADKVRGRPARVTAVKAEEKRELAPQLYDLTTLQLSLIHI